jgi:gamma-glutamyltranspeptidase/glutathione hydrolase
VRATYRGRTVLTNPPPSAGGTLLALAMARLDERADGAPSAVDIVAVMEEAQALRTPAFVEGLVEPGFADRLLARAWARRLTSRSSTATAARAR